MIDTAKFHHKGISKPVSQKIEYLETQKERFEEAIKRHESYDPKKTPFKRETNDHILKVFKARLESIDQQLNRLYTQAGYDEEVAFEVIKPNGS